MTTGVWHFDSEQYPILNEYYSRTISLGLCLTSSNAK